ncbi:BCCT family transporter [Kocuria palustris]|uniref:BCCT family transporter n=1 Tax=Kocuria palustris TaxID=71999 RepID=UPI00345080FF
MRHRASDSGSDSEIQIENRIHDQKAPESVQTTMRLAASGHRTIHPALIPGLDVEDARDHFPTDKVVFAAAAVLVIGVLGWAIIAPDNLGAIGPQLQTWVVTHFGWLLGSLVALVVLFMLVIGFGPTGKIKLGADDSEPEFSTGSWISMLFAAGLGIGLVFYGPLEPLSHFMTPPPAFDVEAGSMDAVPAAMAQTSLHYTIIPWGVYSFIGGALAYAAYRRGRLPLISALFEPIFPNATNRIPGKIIDVFALMVTLFGTATSLGIGALQIRTGTSIITGQPLEGDGILIAIISILTVVFIISAVSGVKRGIRLLSNTNMVLVVCLTIFVAVTGPLLFLLDLIPTTFYATIQNAFAMLSVAPSQGEVESEFSASWTMMYWAWWTSWSPFVGMFIAKISKGRTLREFVTVVMFAPSAISVLWFVVFGGTTMWMELNGHPIGVEGSGENVMFDMLGNLPLTGLTSFLVLVAILIFFTTAADSATNVMGSMSQSGRSNPSTPVTIMWGLALGLVSMFLLLAGGQFALSGLQSVMVTCALPFGLIILGIMVSWANDLRNDPYMIRRRYAREAIYKGVHRGIDEHGDDFVFGATHVDDDGAGADFESTDPALTEWYNPVAEEPETDIDGEPKKD